jgi:predicted transcriptional regulator
VTKDKVLEYIKTHPGAYLRQIRRDLNVSMGVIQYHLYALERERKIIPRRKGLYKRFYPSFKFGDRQQEILDVLSHETQRELLLFIIQNPKATQKQLSEYAKISPYSINWHMKKLIQSGLVRIQRDGHFVRYEFLNGSDEVLKLLQCYHPTIWERWTDRLANTLNEVNLNDQE